MPPGYPGGFSRPASDAPVGDAYINPQYGLQVTGGSSSVRTSWERVREAGARVRVVLLASAAEVWQKPVDSLTTDDGYVLHPDGIQRLAYSDLLGVAPIVICKERDLGRHLGFAQAGSTQRIENPT